jgi:phage I-like protein
MTTAVCGASIVLPNAIGADNSQWVHVLPAGTVTGSDGRGPYTLSDPAAVMSETRRYHGKKQMVVDFEHQSINARQNGKPAPAAGWISGMQAKPDGIWALVNWTAQAAEMIRNKAYRYVSPVFNHDSQGRIGRLLNVALTNTPNLDMTALARSEDFSMNDEQLAALRQALGLSETADFAAVLAAITALQTSANSANPDPAKFVPIGDFERVVADANKLRQGISAQAAETHVGDCIKAGKLMPFMKDWALSLCSVNLPAFDAFIERTGPAFTAMMSTQLPHGAIAPGGGKASTLSEAERLVCANMGMTEEQFAAGRNDL